MIERGSPAFRQTILALFASGMATFALLYCVQPLLPVFGAAFQASPFATSLTLSATTATLAVAMLVASSLSEALGRKKVMLTSVLASSVLGLLCAAAPGYGALVALRALMGLTLSGLPAVAMAYVAEEMHPTAAGFAIGLTIAGNAIGGMCGRLLAGALADGFSWRVALAGIGALGLACAGLVWRFLPQSRHFTARPLRSGTLARALLHHAGDAKLQLLFAEGFLLMGAFAAAYNFIGYRLLAPPYGLSQAAVGLIFSVYLAGVASSALMGHLARRRGNLAVVTLNIGVMLGGVALTTARPLALVVGGIALITAGFFDAHAVASAWVTQVARQNRAQAASLYLFCYYAGSSIAGSLAGLAWARGEWPAVAGFVTLLLGAGLLAALGLARQKVRRGAP